MLYQYHCAIPIQVCKTYASLFYRELLAVTLAVEEAALAAEVEAVVVEEDHTVVEDHMVVEEADVVVEEDMTRVDMVVEEEDMVVEAAMVEAVVDTKLSPLQPYPLHAVWTSQH